ncbi:MAG: Xaa-Pro peptidase family protein [Chloroflexi bacterium]|nr:Xaa-Pro peptidase family protein [Chloroflexota bacterium]
MNVEELPAPDYRARVGRLQEAMAEAAVAAVAIIPGPNLRYLCGGAHFLLERPLVWFLPQEGEPLAVAPKLEAPLFALHGLIARTIIWADAEGHQDAFRQLFAELALRGKRVAIEGGRMRYNECEILRALGAELTNGDPLLNGLRMRKDETELFRLRGAIQRSEAALEQTLSEVRVGMTELEIGARLDALLRENGCEGQAFPTIVHAGGNSALPHHGPLPYASQPGDALIIDFGGVYEGYCADITRTFFFGEPSAKQREVYEVVHRANQTAREAARPGLTCGELDRRTTAVLRESGFGHLIRHRTGHGLGLEAHEEPYIVDGNELPLQPGMVFTVEPGLYEMEVLGVRIEDDLWITEDGNESLTCFPRELRALG